MLQDLEDEHQDWKNALVVLDERIGEAENWVESVQDSEYGEWATQNLRALRRSRLALTKKIGKLETSIVAANAVSNAQTALSAANCEVDDLGVPPGDSEGKHYLDLASEVDEAKGQLQLQALRVERLVEQTKRANRQAREEARRFEALYLLRIAAGLGAFFIFIFILVSAGNIQKAPVEIEAFAGLDATYSSDPRVELSQWEFYAFALVTVSRVSVLVFLTWTCMNFLKIAKGTLGPVAAISVDENDVETEPEVLRAASTSLTSKLG